MNNLHLSAEAQNDLMEIKAYIEEDLLNPSAALTTVSRITKSLRVLQNYAYAGALLSSIADIESDYRFIVSGNYISFYRACGNDILYRPYTLCSPRLSTNSVSRTIKCLYGRKAAMLPLLLWKICCRDLFVFHVILSSMSFCTGRWEANR